MRKLLSLLAILGLAGFVITPIYAQDEELNLNDEEIVADAEDAAIAEDIAADGEEIALETTDEEAVIEGFADLEAPEDFNAFIENEEVQKAIDEAGLTNEEAAGLFGAFVGLFAGLGIVGIIIAIIWGILLIIAMWKIFEKAGEAGWKSIIPIYNVYIMYKIVGMKNWFWYILIVAFVCGFIAGLLGEESTAAVIITIVASLFSGIVSIVAAYKLPRKFGWGVFTSILYVLFTGICTLILGFGNYKYQGKSEKTVVEA